MTRTGILALGAIAAIGVGGLVLMSTNGPGTQLADGGFIPATLPDGAPWALAPDAAFIPLGATSGGFYVVATPNGYQEQQVVFTDAGPIYSSTRAFSGACAIQPPQAPIILLADGGIGPDPSFDAGTVPPCLFADGGQVGPGTYAAGLVSGPGCLPRPMIELSGFTGAPAGCVP